jgi:hypothetical protein
MGKRLALCLIVDPVGYRNAIAAGSCRACVSQVEDGEMVPRARPLRLPLEVAMFVRQR